MLPASKVHSLEPFTNGHLSPLPSDLPATDFPSSHAESDLSDTRPPSAPESPSSSIESEPESHDEDAQDVNTPISGSDEDAEGSDDDDFDLDMPQHTIPPPPRIARSSTPGQGRKRKYEPELEEEIKKHPELYATRRSIESDSEDDDEDSSYGIRPAGKRRRARAPSKSKSSKTPTPALPSSDSESEEDAYYSAKKHIATKKQRLHQRQVAAGMAPPSQSHTRFSGRSKGLTNYNEDADEQEFEASFDEEMTPNTAAVADEYPLIDLVLDSRPKDGVEFTKPDINKRDFEYLIKWKGEAHLHARFHTYEELKGYRVGKMDNFFNKIIWHDIQYAINPDLPLEDKEKWLIERELTRDNIEEFKNIERIIGSQRGEDDVEYYVKWKGLNYEYCTWETKELVETMDMDQIDKFLQRSQNLPTSDKLPHGRGKYVPFPEQPDYIKHGQLREFQIKGVNFLARNWCLKNNVMLADEMGLGKTVQTIAFMNWLRHEKKQQGPFLIVVPLSTMPAWQETFNDWCPDINYVVFNGNKEARDIIKDYELLVNSDPRKTKFHALLTTYEYIQKEFSYLNSIKWQFMAVDEAHRLKNSNSTLYLQLTAMKSECRLLITGTPMQNNLGELRALMDFLLPGEVQIEDDIDLAGPKAQEQIERLTEAIRPFMIRRTKQVVEKDLPPKTEKIMRVELSDIQLEYYKNILMRNFSELNKGAAKGQQQSLLNIMMELKKASNHPYMFPNVEERQLNGSTERHDQLRKLVTSSGKMMLLEKLLEKLKEGGHRVLIFSQMVRMLDLLSDYMSLRGYRSQRLDGTMPSAVRRKAISHFQAEGSDDFCFLLSTRAGGLGINLMAADTVILFDSDWNPQADLQAMARAHRIGQKNPVTVYRFVSKDTVEEEVLERARNKLMLEFLTIQRGVTESDIKQKLAQKGVNLDEPASADDISRILKRRGQKMFEQADNQKKLESLDINAMLETADIIQTEQPEGITADGGEEFLRAFEYTDVKVDLEWDQIIPKEQLEAIKAEEEKRTHERFVAQVAAEETSRRRKQTASDEREQRAAKKKAREAAKAVADDESGEDVADDPKRPLNEKEVYRLYRALTTFGDFDEMQKEIMAKAKLTNRDPLVLQATVKSLLDESEKAIKADNDRIAEREKTEGKALTKKDRKEVVFSYPGIKQANANTLLERPAELKMVREVIRKETDVKRFRIPEAAKTPKDFSCEWGAREDGMLIVGISRYGWGEWVSVRDDPDLNMQDKCFLEEARKENKDARAEAGEKAKQKTPTQVHLNRRAKYLITVLKDKTSGGTDLAARKAIENHHRNVKKRGLPILPGVNGAPPRKSHVDKARNRGNSQSESRQSIDRTPDNRRKTIDDADRKQKRHYDDDDDRSHKRMKGTPDLKRRKDDDGDRDRDRDQKRRKEENGHRPSNSINGGSSRCHEDDRKPGHRSPEHRKPQLKSELSSNRSPDNRKAHGNRTESQRPDAHRFHSNGTEKKPHEKKPHAERDAELDRVSAKTLDTVAHCIKAIPILAKEKKGSQVADAIIAIGDFIESPGKHQDRTTLWEYVRHKCFKGMTPDKLKGVYQTQKKKAEDAANSKKESNGKVEGTAISNKESNGQAGSSSNGLKSAPVAA
ncbi:hypothetical protein EJ08DRAFT_670177 [Tothia fuscella]|uniref:Uncharacterized protein n=1 Tax=Tothia fuscella TaxID=1048955 RepID=A0A9P4NSX7_9PEZI|nr:hypothetical protein EJ08DRAFT_670177 [Tothia fuscella]